MQKHISHTNGKVQNTHNNKRSNISTRFSAESQENASPPHQDALVLFEGVFLPLPASVRHTTHIYRVTKHKLPIHYPTSVRSETANCGRIAYRFFRADENSTRSAKITYNMDNWLVAAAMLSSDPNFRQSADCRKLGSPAPKKKFTETVRLNNF